MNVPQNFEISQQSRDAVAVLHAAGEESAFVFGNSSGAVIALDLARTHPATAVRAVVVHEAACGRFRSHASGVAKNDLGSDFLPALFDGIHSSPSLAALRFMLGVNLPVGQLIKATKGVNAHRGRAANPTSAREMRPNSW